MSSPQSYSQEELLKQAITYMSTKINQLNRQTQMSQNEQATQKYLKEMNKMLNQGINKFYSNTKTN
jgi:phage shock protein A